MTTCRFSTPAAGTGTFVTNLIEYLPVERLEYKYLNEIHANEVAILPYYIANLNIEYTYKQRTNRYLEFPNLCFVDTLDNMDWRGTSGSTFTYQMGLKLGAISEENLLRLKGQNEQTISVIIGNPPYNANQRNWNEFNPNIIYPDIDQRIQDTYVAESSAQKTKQYDMYKRFIRWASDRLADDGIIAFITNRSYLESFQDDGFRKSILKEFDHLYVMDLGGDTRRHQGVGNVFNITVGVAVGFFVRTKSKQPGQIHYSFVPDGLPSYSKLAILSSNLHFPQIEFENICPDSKHNWLNQSVSDFGELLPLIDRKVKHSSQPMRGQTVFGLYSLAVSTNRDEWVYDFDIQNLREKALFFADTYNDLLDNSDYSYPISIKWSRDLRNEFQRGRRIIYSEANRIQSLYRPFVVKHHFADFTMNDVLTGKHYAMFGSDLRQPNKVICFLAPAGRPVFFSFLH